MVLFFSVDTSGNGYKDLVRFSSTNGANPYGSLTLVGHTLFGMTETGGEYRDGRIFSIDTSGSPFLKILDFNGARGANPYGDLTLSGKNIYGMTSQGGANNYGVVFKFDTSLATFAEELTTTPGSLNLYPNPNNGSFSLVINHPNATPGYQIDVFNILGERVYTSTVPVSNTGGSSFIFQMNLSSQPGGVYLYRVITENGELVGDGKVIIQK